MTTIKVQRAVRAAREGRLGDLVARATKAVGIRPCPGCEKRRVALNRLGRYLVTGR